MFSAFTQQNQVTIFTSWRRHCSKLQWTCTAAVIQLDKRLNVLVIVRKKRNQCAYVLGNSLHTAAKIRKYVWCRRKRVDVLCVWWRMLDVCARLSCEYVLGEVTTTTESNIVWLRHSLLTNCRVELTRAGLGYHFSGNVGEFGYGQWKGPKSGKWLGILCSQGHFIVAAQQNNLPVLYSYRNWFSRIILINKCAFVWHIACNFVCKFLSGEW